MPTFPKETIRTVRQRLLDGMAHYMQGAGDEEDSERDCGYSQQHIDRCAGIIDAYLAAVTPGRKLSEAQICAAVKQVVLELNALNAECSGTLIETDQREDLCQLILVGAMEAGLKTSDDITEEWREW